MEKENFNIEEESYKQLKIALKKTSTFTFPTKTDHEIYDILFINHKIETPIEEITMGEEQFDKFFNNWNDDVNRKYQMGMAYQTMTNPDFIYEREEVVDGKVRKKNIYAKAYIHRDYYFVLSIVALFDKDGKSCISSHIVNLNNGLNQAKKYGRMIYIKKGLFDNLDLNTEDFEFKNFIKGKESLTKYQNKKYPSPNLMTDTQLFDFRFRQKFDIEYFVKKEKCFENFENLILDKFKLRHNYNEDFLSRINYYMESYIFENLYDAIELMHNSKEFVENLKDIRKDLEETFSEDVKNLNDWQIYDLYEGLVYEIALKQIKEYKDRVIKNPKSIDSRLETINRIFSISTSKEK